MGTALRAAIASLPGGPGVYRFRDAAGRVLYIGRAADLRRRVGSYWTDLCTRPHLTRMVPQVVCIEAVACNSAHEAAWLERNVLERSKPRWNRIRGGMEVPVYIRLDRGTGSPRLTVVHTPFVHSRRSPAAVVDVFGPYLGGTRTRLAVSALDRVLPLRYTDDRLSGCQRDLARERGVETPDRDVLLTTIVDVLQRQPAAVAAVRKQLARQRDRASASLAFELAARIQQEIEAIDWVVATQEVTLPSSIAGPSTRAPVPADYDVYGWADGLLIHFEVRHGRLCAWNQRTCPHPAARRYLDQTPTSWRTFASRNAELARRLVDAHTVAS